MRRLIRRDAPGSDRVPLILLVPNMLTLAGMALGLTSIRFAMDERFTVAATLIFFAAILDGLDGQVARRLQATSEIGAQLDSLSDFLCFGVAPGVLVYAFLLEPAGSLGWIAVLLYAAAACLRLARFNVMSGLPDTAAPSRHFVGVPAPGAAMLALLPVFLSLGGLVTLPTFVVAVWLLVVALLMVSKLRTPSPKGLRVPRPLVALIMFATAAAVGLAFTRPWLMLVLLDLAYATVLGFLVVQARGRLFTEAGAQDATPSGDGPGGDGGGRD
jgi:CDP-diacylglycerol---serine O-phosphatidyltransferase